MGYTWSFIIGVLVGIGFWHVGNELRSKPQPEPVVKKEPKKIQDWGNLTHTVEPNVTLRKYYHGDKLIWITCEPEDQSWCFSASDRSAVFQTIRYDANKDK